MGLINIIKLSSILGSDFVGEEIVSWRGDRLPWEAGGGLRLEFIH